MNMANLPIGALIAIVAFAVLCMAIGVACMIAALRQRASETVKMTPLARESFADGAGVLVYRAFNRLLISSLSGGVLIALLRARSRA